jgi:soluble lytic murein transglycosylase
MSSLPNWRTLGSLNRVLLSLLLFALVAGFENDGVSAQPSRPACVVAQDCFAEAVRALNRRDAESAKMLLTELLQQFPATPWAGRAALVLGRQYRDQGDRQAVVYLRDVPRQLPLLGDYAYSYLGDALFAASDWNGAGTAFDLLYTSYPDSVLRPQALYRAAESWFQADDCRRSKERQAVFLSAFPKHEQVSAVLLRQGDCELKNADKPAAIHTYRRIWTQYAAAPHATEAAIRLQGLKEKGTVIPELTSQEWWTRAKVLFDAAQYPPAIQAIQEALKGSSGLPDRAQALLQLAIARIRLKQYDEARPVLDELVRMRTGPVSQESALWQARVYLRQGQDEPFLELARVVDAGLLSGEQKAKFLLLLAAHHADRGRTDKALDTYRRAADSIGVGATAAEALWQAGWLYYKEGRYTEALWTFDDIARAQPAAMLALQAQYWKARALEKLGESKKAIEAFHAVCREAPNSYYCQMGRTRDGWQPATQELSPAATGSVESTESPGQTVTVDIHYQRALELQTLGWQREAGEELVTLIPKVVHDQKTTLWLARLLAATGEYHRSLSLIRTYFSDMLDRGGAGVQRAVWETAYPGGYFGAIEALPDNQGIDSRLVTAVIREESSYNPLAVSSAGALGLMQVMPQTGQKIASQFGPQTFSRERLFEPCYNIRLGSAYLRQLGTKFGNNLAHVIAAYNAGPDAVTKWIQQFGDKDRDEFIESIPYTETRNYVKKVLRSYGEYKRIYGLDGSQSFLDKVC